MKKVLETSWKHPGILFSHFCRNPDKMFNHSSLIIETDMEPSLVHNLIDRDVYVSEIDKLKPHAHTLLMMLNEIRHKLRAMDKTDPRVPTYK